MKKEDKKFIEKKQVADHEEYVIKKAPTRTWWGKILVILILVGMVGLLVASAIVSIINIMK